MGKVLDELNNHKLKVPVL